MKSFSLVILLATFAGEALCQVSQGRNSIDLSASLGQSRGTLATGFIHRLNDQSRQFEVSIGGRLTSYFGSDQYFVTAPAELVKGSSGPGVLFKENIPANMDSLLMGSPNIFFINAFLNLGYRFNEKLSAGFNIDVIGFSFGAQKQGTYINGSVMQNTTASPASFNLLLIGENDLGSLNSEFYIKYRLNEKWSLKGGAQHLFVEYTTATDVQQFPEPNDRFRQVTTMFMLGACYELRP